MTEVWFVDTADGVKIVRKPTPPKIPPTTIRIDCDISPLLEWLKSRNSK